MQEKFYPNSFGGKSLNIDPNSQLSPAKHKHTATTNILIKNSFHANHLHKTKSQITYLKK